MKVETEIDEYMGRSIDAHSKLGGFVIATGKVVATAGANMLFVDDGSGDEIAVTISDSVDIRIIE